MDSTSKRRLIAQVALDLPDSFEPSECHLYADGFADVVFVYMLSQGTIVYHIEESDGTRVPDPRMPQEVEEWN